MVTLGIVAALPKIKNKKIKCDVVARVLSVITS